MQFHYFTRKDEEIGKVLGKLFSCLIFFTIMLYFLRRFGVLSIPYTSWIGALVVVFLILHVFKIQEITKVPSGYSPLSVLKGFWKGMKIFGALITNVVNFILLIPVYYIGIGATSIVARISKKKFLKMKESGWKKYDLETQPKEEYYKMY